MFNPLPVVLADYRRNRLLVMVTTLLIALAVAIGVAVIAQERALRQGSARAADDFDLVIGAPGSPTQLVLTSVYLQIQSIPLLDGQVLAKLSTHPGVSYAAPIAFGDSVQGYPIIGTTRDFALRGGRLQPSSGRIFLRRGEAVIGADVNADIGTQFTPTHGMHEDDDHEHDTTPEHHHALHYTVVGRLPARNNAWDHAILVPVEDVWAVHGLPTGHSDSDDQIGPPWDATALPGVPAIAVKPKTVGAAYTLRNQYRNASSTAVFPAEVLNELYAALGDVRDMMSILAIAAQILVVTAVLMALLVGFLARQRQFAVLRAVGASRSYVFAVIWSEVSLLIFSGTLGGLGLGYAAAQTLAYLLAQKTGFSMPIHLGAPEFWLVATLTLLGLLIALIPAQLGLRRSISTGLKA